MKKKLVMLVIAVFFLFGGVEEFQNVKFQTQADEMKQMKDEYPEIIPGG